MQQQLHIDQIDTLSILERDANGNRVNVPFDAVPTWTNSDPTAATLDVASDGLSAVLTPVTEGGVTTVTVQAIVGGATFTASNDYTIVAGAVASIEIVDTFSPKP